MNNRSALNQYNQVRAHAQTEGASPHRLIQILMDGAIEKVTVAKGLMARGNVQEKIRNINWAMSIIDGLRQSLDMEKGGEIAENLEALYDYMQRRLIVANAEDNIPILDEVSNLLLEIKSAWDAIPLNISKDLEVQSKDNPNNTAIPSLG